MYVLVAFVSYPSGCIDGLPLGKLDIEDPGHDDFELWSPSEERADRCLFGRQVNKSHLCLIPKPDCLHFYFVDCVSSS